MKRFVSVLLSVLFVFALGGCRNRDGGGAVPVKEFLPRMVEIYGPGGRGSGIIYRADDSETLVLTNYHVSGDSGSALSLRFYGDSEFFNTDTRQGSVVEVTGYDAYYDLALLRVERGCGRRFAVPDFDTAPEVGSPAFSLGNALGTGISAGDGCIAGQAYVNVARSGYKVLPLVQTTAPVNQGCSGGALLTAKGLCGVCSYKQISFNGDYVQDVNYAVPAAAVKSVCEKILAKKGALTRYNIVAEISGTLKLADKMTLVSLGGKLAVKGGEYDGGSVDAVNGGPATAFGVMAAAYEERIELIIDGVTVVLD